MWKQIQTINKTIKQEFEFYFEQSESSCVHVLFSITNRSSKMHLKTDRRSFLRSSVLLVINVFLSKCNICKSEDGFEFGWVRVYASLSWHDVELFRTNEIDKLTFCCDVFCCSCVSSRLVSVFLDWLIRSSRMTLLWNFYESFFDCIIKIQWNSRFFRFQFHQRIRGIRIMTTTTEMIMQIGHRFSIGIIHTVRLERWTVTRLCQQHHHNDVTALKCAIVHRWWRNWLPHCYRCQWIW